MSDEHDSWFQDAFGFDVGGAVQAIRNEVSSAATQVENTVTQVVQGVQGAAEGVIDTAVGAVSGVAKTVGGVLGLGNGEGGGGGAPSAGGGGAAGGGAEGSFPLKGSVGRGGKNQSADVKAVQAALGITADGQCGGQTIAAIEAFQRQQGSAKADGRVDPGGATERALAGGGGGGKGAGGAGLGSGAADAPDAPGGAANAAVGQDADDAAGASGGDADGGGDAGTGLFDQLKQGAQGLLDGAKDLGGEALQGAGELVDDVKQLGGQLAQGVEDLASGDAGGASPLLSKLGASPPPVPAGSNPFDYPEVRLEVEKLAINELRQLATDHAIKASGFWQSALDQAREEFKKTKDQEEKEREGTINLVISIAMLAGGPLLSAAASSSAQVLNGQEMSVRLNAAVETNVAGLAQRAGVTDAQTREAWVQQARDRLALDWISAKMETFDAAKAQAGMESVSGTVKEKAVALAAETDEKKLGVAFCDQLQLAQNQAMNTLIPTIKGLKSVEALSGIVNAFANATVAAYKAVLLAEIQHFKEQISKPFASRAAEKQGGSGTGNVIVKMNAYGRMRFAHVRYLPSSANYVFHSWVTPDMEASAAKLCVGEIDPKTIDGHLPAPELQPNPARVVQMDAWGRLRLAIVSVADEGLFFKDYGVMNFVRWVAADEVAQAQAKGNNQVGGLNTVSPGSVKGLRPPPEDPKP